MPAPGFLPLPCSATILLAGPTASGKSAVALLLAERLRAEIISVDSMQVYRGLDVGTAKPSPAERARVPHHLIDVVEVTEPFDAARFVARAQAAVTDVHARERVAILCGGTGLYFRSLLEGLGEAPPADPAVRAALEATPLEELVRELAQADPVTHATIDRANPRRVIRAVEVIRVTAKPFSAQRAAWSASEVPLPLLVLRREPEDLRVRIEARVDEMFARGLVEETRQLLARGLAENRTAAQALGYRQVIEHVRGERSLAETVASVKRKTRQFARRQMTWFRHQARATWIDVLPTEPPAAVEEKVWREWTRGRSAC